MCGGREKGQLNIEECIELRLEKEATEMDTTMDTEMMEQIETIITTDLIPIAEALQKTTTSPTMPPPAANMQQFPVLARMIQQQQQ